MAAWIVLSHDGCTFVERNEDLFAEPSSALPGAAEIMGRRELRALGGIEHERLHRPLSHSWRPDPIANYLRTAIGPIVEHRLATLAGRSDVELFSDLARLLPIAVVTRVLGLPDADHATLDQAKVWMEAVLAWRHTFGEDADIRDAAISATRALEPVLIDTIRARRDHPEDDTISLLWDSGRRVFSDWNERDVLDNVRFLFEGGSETTSFLICNAAAALLDSDGAQRTTWLGDPAAFSQFLEEVLRHSTIVHLRARRATQTLVLEGARISAGERVIAVNAAANRDPARWERPAQFDPDRPRLFGHLAFNVGPRHCAGAHLARLEATETVRGLFQAFPALTHNSAMPASQWKGFVSRARRPLHVRMVPDAPGG
jgi:cytochrome P450